MLMARLAYLDETIGPLGVVVVVTVGIVLVKNSRTDQALHFPLRHLPVQGIGDDDVNGVHTMSGEHIKHDLENRLPDVWRRHRWQRQTYVINRNGDTHSRFELCEEWIAAEGMIQGVTDRGL